MRDFLPTDDRPVWVTPAAAKAARAELDEDGGGGFLRISMYPLDVVLAPQYAMDFDDEMKPGDVVMDFDGLNVVMDAESARRLRGTVIDVVETPDGPGFEFHRPES
jgi:iron-sulfur cluster assembly protein